MLLLRARANRKEMREQVTDDDVPFFIYDPDCGFCMKALAWFERRLPSMMQLAAHPDVDLPRFGLTTSDAAEQAWVYRPDRPPVGGHLAIAELLRDQGVFWSAASFMLRTPPLSWVAKPGYRWVAGNRYRLSGGTSACRIDSSPGN